jgi:hypothetical protein
MIEDVLKHRSYWDKCDPIKLANSDNPTTKGVPTFTILSWAIKVPHTLHAPLKMPEDAKRVRLLLG